MVWLKEDSLNPINYLAKLKAWPPAPVLIYTEQIFSLPYLGEVCYTLIMTPKKSTIKPLPETPTAPFLPLSLPTIPGAPNLFNPATPVPSPFSNHNSSEEEHLTVTDHLANLQLAGLYALWSSPHTTNAGILALISRTGKVIAERSKQYSLRYGSNDKNSSGRRLTAFPID